MSRRIVLTALMAVFLILGTAAPGSSEAASQTYIVVLDPSANPHAVAAEIARSNGGRVGFVYEHALSGFSIDLPPAAAEAVARNPQVAYIEPDREVTISAQTVPTGVRRIFADTNTYLDVDGADDQRVDVDVAVIDTGVDFQHPDLNVVGGRDCTIESGGPPWARTASCGPGGDDDHYHGTHVAGSIAALDNGIGVVGVAPGARIWAVKVLKSNGSGSTATVVAGIDWVAANASTIEVANMSLGGSGYSDAMFQAIQGAVNAGVAFAVAAGNDDGNAANYSPAAFGYNSAHQGGVVLTVSALADFDGSPGGSGSATCRSDQDDTLANFSNWGSLVGIAAPGVCILSTYPLEQGEYGTISGTSMASPHAAGALALLASRTNPNSAAAVRNLYSQVIQAGNLNWTDDSGDGVKEPLLGVTGFNPVLIAGSGGSGATTDDPPSVAVTGPAAGGTVSGTVTVRADASDDNGVVGVEFFVDGGSIGVDSNGADGWSAPWNTTGYGDGSHTVEAVATDTANQAASDSVTVTVDNVVEPITLSVAAYKVKGIQTADLSWSGALGSVDVRRNGSVITTVSGTSYTDSTGLKGGGSATYQVCQTGTATCSAVSTATW